MLFHSLEGLDNIFYIFRTSHFLVSSFILLWLNLNEAHVLAACLGLQCLPAYDWHCPFCRDKFGPCKRAAGESRPNIIRLTRVVKAPESEPGGCVVCRFVVLVVVYSYACLTFILIVDFYMPIYTRKWIISLKCFLPQNSQHIQPLKLTKLYLASLFIKIFMDPFLLFVIYFACV